MRFLRTHGNQCTCPHELILFQCSHLSDLHRRRVGSSLSQRKQFALPCDGISVNPLWLGTVVDSVVHGSGATRGALKIYPGEKGPWLQQKRPSFLAGTVIRPPLRLTAQLVAGIKEEQSRQSDPWWWLVYGAS